MSLANPVFSVVCRLKLLVYVTVFVFFLQQGARELHADVLFGSQSGPNFSLTFKEVDNAGNAADTSWRSAGIGSVGYSFGISEFEISQGMIDVYNYYNPAFVISYDVMDSNKQRPAVAISWNEAARFVNWLNTSTGAFAAYRVNASSTEIGNIAAWRSTQTADFDTSNQFRSKRTTFALPTLNEWYKSAYYDPSLNGGIGGYWNWGVRTTSAPRAVSSGIGADEVVYQQSLSTPPAAISAAGGRNYYDLMAMSGNAWEWTETPMDMVWSGVSQRAMAGGAWADDDPADIARQNVIYYDPGNHVPQGGFRVISLNADQWESGGDVGTFNSVPEPASLSLGLILCGAAASRRILSSFRSVRRKGTET